ncbi:MAG: CYTH domain-containing protein [Bacteroidales bacterium]|nr:CYTH domain-containing protein [Bacteroidales bacterium]
MALEIERKFLVKGPFQALATRRISIRQGYLPTTSACSVRIRLEDEQAWLTIKGKGNASGTTRYEWEKSIDPGEANELLALCTGYLIDKERFLVPVGTHTFEVDVFWGVNEGLVVAEIELSDENEVFERPDWLGAEVTGEKRYYNASLTVHPFREWTH